MPRPTVQVNLRLDPDLVARADEEARRRSLDGRRVSRQDLVREALERLLGITAEDKLAGEAA